MRVNVRHSHLSLRARALRVRVDAAIEAANLGHDVDPLRARRGQLALFAASGLQVLHIEQILIAPDRFLVCDELAGRLMRMSMRLGARPIQSTSSAPDEVAPSITF